jgi:hypothetical protein
MDWLNYANQGATRNQPIAPELAQALGFLPEMGITMDVFSGGQPAQGSGGARVGSVRHDDGGSADVFFNQNGRRLDWANPDDVPIYQDIVRRARANGVTGFGAGDGYMQPGSMHVGFGTPAVWGAGGRGANAPEWLRAAYDGAPAGQQPTISTRNAPDTPQAVGRDTRSALGLLQNEGNPMAQQPQGLLGSLGVQRRDPNAQGETSQPFYNRQSFGDTLARIAPALGRMGVMGLEGPMQAQLDTRNQRQGDERAQQAQAAQRNQTREWIASQPNGDQYAAMFDAVGGEATLQAMQAANAPTDQTSGMQNYDFLIAQGMEPSAAMERAFGAGGTSVNVSTGPSESAFSQETGKIIAQEADSVAQQGAAAQRSMGQLDTLEQALLNSPSGAGGAIANMAANIGIKTEGVENLELANAIISQLVPSQRPPGSGVMSDADLALFKASLPRLINTREGNQLIIDTMRNIAQYDMQRGEIARGMQLGQITPDVAFTQYNDLGNPLSAFQNQGGGAATPTAGSGGIDVDPALLEFMTPEERALFQ